MSNALSTMSILALSVMGMFAPTVKADEWDKKTNITINQAIEVEGTVLPPGSYVLKLVDSPNRNLVAIWNEYENRLIATVFTIPIYRFQSPDNSKFRFFESEVGQPPALHAWFYPGDQTGFEFRKAAATVEAAQRQSTTASDASSN
ncbi:MAG: hypothetical protein ABSH09_35620 [Bryobacteraceae bacterium]|jgi:hypothetical protein